jgi:CBS domain-containing protein
LRLVGHRVGDAMLYEPVTVAPDASIAELHALLRKGARRAFPMVRPTGYEASSTRTRSSTRWPGRPAAASPTAMHSPIAAGDDLEERLRTLLSTPARALAVVDGSRVVGVLRAEDVQHLVDEDGISGKHDSEHDLGPRT